MTYMFRNGAFEVSGGWWHEDCIVGDPLAIFDVEFPGHYDDRDREWDKIPTPVLDALFVSLEPNVRFLMLALVGRGFLHDTADQPQSKEIMGLLVGPAKTGKSAFLTALGSIYPPGALEYYWIESNSEEDARRKLKAAVAQRKRVVVGYILPFTTPFSDVAGLKAELPWIMVKAVKAYHHFTKECLHGRNPMPQ